MSAVEWENSDSRELLWDCMVRLGAGELTNSHGENGWDDPDMFAKRVGKFALALMVEHGRLVTREADIEATRKRGEGGAGDTSI